MATIRKYRYGDDCWTLHLEDVPNGLENCDQVIDIPVELYQEFVEVEARYKAISDKIADIPPANGNPWKDL